MCILRLRITAPEAELDSGLIFRASMLHTRVVDFFSYRVRKYVVWGCPAFGGSVDSEAVSLVHPLESEDRGFLELLEPRG